MLNKVFANNSFTFLFLVSCCSSEDVVWLGSWQELAVVGNSELHWLVVAVVDSSELYRAVK